MTGWIGDTEGRVEVMDVWGRRGVKTVLYSEDREGGLGIFLSEGTRMIV